MRSKNPFIALTNIYKNQVKHHDKSGYGKSFKKCAHILFNKLNEQLDCPPDMSYFTDIEYRDGYYLFGFGTNTVVHFHVDKCPDWLFGIWWDIPTKKKQKEICGTMFAQFEGIIDKFKPTTSAFVSNFSMNLQTGELHDIDPLINMINFISYRPYLSFCYQCCGWDSNEGYTDAEAKVEYDKYLQWEENRKKYTVENDEKILNFIREIILPCFNDAKLIDRGENWSPRYEVVAPFKKNMDKADAPGIYDWADPEDENWKRIMSDYDTLERECDEISDKYEFIWYPPVDPIIIFTKKK